MRLVDHLRSEIARLVLIYGAFFVVWSIALNGLAYWQSSRYLDGVVDEILEQRAQYLMTVDRRELPKAIGATAALDLHDIMSFGLFGADGKHVAGDLEHIPAGLEADGRVHEMPQGAPRPGHGRHRARGLATRLPSGERLVIVRDTSVIDGLGEILGRTLRWGLVLTVIPGLAGAFLLSRRPLRRVREIEAAIEPIVHGNLGRRLPVSGRGDEVDLLAGMVNRMLGEVERLLGEVKGVSDNIAHDLRTPLTRLRSQLHRLQHKGDSCEDRAAMIDRCIVDVDSLLERFRALLRISELENLRRRAGFGEADLAETLARVHELYAPLAEDRGITLRIGAEPGMRVHADPALLVEAVSNLVANAIRFTPDHGHVAVDVRAERRGPFIEVCDNGPGIPEGERDLVLQRFYRGENGRGAEQGHGLGLSIVSAIVRLHGFRLRIGANAGGGACVGIECWGDERT